MGVAPAVAKPARNEGIVAPVPLDAPPLDVKFKGCKPDEVLWFLNENGERLFAECRWNLDGAKEVRPSCYTGKGWKLVAFPAPRPLYNLDKLRARPAEPVWLFEGPRKAKKAEACFSGAVTTANAGGTNAIKQTDSARPLRGRNVTLWCDSDKAGANWQAQMIVALRAAGVASLIRVVERHYAASFGADRADTFRQARQVRCCGFR